MTSGFLNPTGVGVAQGLYPAAGGAAAGGVGVALGVQGHPHARLADPQSRDLENPDVALEASGLTAPKADL